MWNRQPAVYIMASKRNGTLYTGVTGDLPARVWQHKNGEEKGFVREYGVTMLAYFELCDDIHAAILREKQIKKWRRAWKLELIEGLNPGWRDLSADIF